MMSLFTLTLPEEEIEEEEEEEEEEEHQQKIFSTMKHDLRLPFYN